MDPLAHTLVGASLAETGLRRLSPLATGTLIAGANIPDVDAFAGILGRDMSLYLRRGHTHGVVAMVALPLALTGVVLAYDRLWRRRRDPEAEPARFAPLLLLAYLSTLTHPALDWLNTYGVRLLMPFDGTWFYGDSLFIVDPWMWLMLGAPVVLARSRGRLSLAAWTVLGAVATALVMGTPFVPLPAKIVWVVGVAGIVGSRVAGLSRATTRAWAIVAVGLVALYIGGMIVGSRVARAQARAFLIDRGARPLRIMADPAPTNPFAHGIIADLGERYVFATVDWLADEPVQMNGESSGDVRTPIVDAARAAPSVRGMVNWLRYPSYSVERLDDGYRVEIKDMRYWRRGAPIGYAVVELDRDLRPRD